MSHESFDTKYLSYLSGFIRKHDGKAFAELYNYTYQRVYKYAFAFLKDPYLAQDAVQEIYTSIYKNIDALMSSRKIKFPSPAQRQRIIIAVS